MKSRGLFPQAYWYWIGVGATIGYVFLFNFLFAVALKYLDRKYYVPSLEVSKLRMNVCINH